MIIPIHYLFDEEKTGTSSQPERVAIYARVSSAENKPNLDSQAERLVAYCSAKGYQVEKVVKEIGSGVNDARPKLLHLLEDVSTTVIVVEHKDRLSRFGVRYIETLLRVQGRRLEIVNEPENDKEDLLADLTAILSIWNTNDREVNACNGLSMKTTMSMGKN